MDVLHMARDAGSSAYFKKTWIIATVVSVALATASLAMAAQLQIGAAGQVAASTIGGSVTGNINGSAHGNVQVGGNGNASGTGAVASAGASGSTTATASTETDADLLSRISAQVDTLGATLRTDANLVWQQKDDVITDIQSTIKAAYLELKAESINVGRSLQGVSNASERAVIEAASRAKLSTRATADVVSGTSVAIAEGVRSDLVTAIATQAAAAGVTGDKIKAGLDELGTLYAEGHFADVAQNAAANVRLNAEQVQEAATDFVQALKARTVESLRTDLEAHAETNSSFAATAKAMGD